MATENSNKTKLRKKIESLAFKGRNSKFNIKNIFTETYFSNMLAWLFEKDGDHGLDSRFTTFFIRHIAQKRSKRQRNKLEKVSAGSTQIVREFHFIKNEKKEETKNKADILLLDFDKKDDFVMIIENKLFGKDGKNQLTKYNNHIKNKFEKFKCKEFVYLTLFGHKPSDKESRKHWANVSWTDDILNILNDPKLLKNTKSHKTQIKEFVKALDWSKYWANHDGIEIIEEFEKEYLQIIANMINFDLERYIKDLSPKWKQDKVLNKQIKIKHDRVKRSPVTIKLEESLNISLYSTNGQLKFLIPFGIHYQQLEYMIEYYVREIYEKSTLKSWQENYQKTTHRQTSKDMYYEEHKADKTLLEVVYKRRYELKTLKDICACE